MATDPGFAPAKINLTLHVTGQRADGYHLLDSLVAFADVGDRVSATPSEQLRLSVDGPNAAGLSSGDDNLVLRAARRLGDRGADLRLEKRLPVASGIGGGSSDAAATLRVLSRLWGVAVPSPSEAAGLGADVPVCLDPRPRRMGGTGEILSEPVALPQVWIVLANPGVSLSTPEVFRRLNNKTNAPMPLSLPSMVDRAAFVEFIAECRNDLEAPARDIQPVIGTVIDELLGTPGCLFARMSGSGATCFGLYGTSADTENARMAIKDRNPGWWVESGQLLR